MKEDTKFYLSVFGQLFVAVLLILGASLIEPEMSNREKISPSYVGQAVNGRRRLAPWMEYLDDTTFYFVEGEEEDPRACTYITKNNRFGRNASIYIWTDGLEEREYYGRARFCVIHEVGHHIDYSRGRISRTDEFRRAVAQSTILVYDLPEGAYHWRAWGEFVAHFPGVNGNPLHDTGWGGYGELYASLHEVDYLIQIPPPLQTYFKDFIPWGWWGEDADA